MRVEVPANRAFLTSGWQFSGLRTHVLVATQRRWAARFVLVAREQRAADHSEARKENRRWHRESRSAARARGLSAAFPTEGDSCRGIEVLGSYRVVIREMRGR